MTCPTPVSTPVAPLSSHLSAGVSPHLYRYLSGRCATLDNRIVGTSTSGAEAGSKGGAHNPQGIGGKSGKRIVNVNNINIDNARETAMGTSTAFTMRTLEKRAPGERTDIQPRNSMLQGSEYAEVLADNDINRMTAHRWQTVATVRYTLRSAQYVQKLTSSKH